MFKDPATGNFYTQSLFLELSYQDTSKAIYTLKDDDHEYNGNTYKSIKKLYLEIADPTEYAFAEQCFANWRHWKRISENTGLLKPYIQEWRDELEIKLRSQAIKSIAIEASSDNKGALQAAKWLADKGWIEKKGAGRPTKEAVEGERKHRAAVKQQVEDDLERITQH